MATVVTLIFDDLGSEPFYDQKCLFLYKIMYYLKCQWYLACKITVELRMSRQFKTSCSGDFNEKKKYFIEDNLFNYETIRINFKNV